MNMKKKKRRKAGIEQDDPKQEKLWGIWEVPLSPFAVGAELAMRGSRRTTKKNGGSDDDATRSAGQGKQVEREPTRGGSSPKGEDSNEM